MLHPVHNAIVFTNRSFRERRRTNPKLAQFTDAEEKQLREWEDALLRHGHPSDFQWYRHESATSPRAFRSRAT